MDKKLILKKVVEGNFSLQITLLYFVFSFLLLTDLGHEFFSFEGSDFNINSVIDKREIYFLIISAILLYFVLQKQKLLSKKIIISDNQFSKIFCSLPIGMQILNIKTGKCLKVNKQLCDITGYSYDEYMEDNFFIDKLLLDNDRKLSSYTQLQKERKLINTKARIQTKNNGVVTVLLNVEMLDDLGKDIALISVTNISEEIEIRETIKQVVNNVPINKQSKFYHQITAQIAKIFHSDFVLITELGSDSATTVDSLIFYHDGAFEPNFSYVLKGTPCEKVFQNQVSYFPKDVQHLFPEDDFFKDKGVESYIAFPLYNLENKVTGALILLFKSPFYFTEHQKGVLQIFAAKITSEFKYRQSISQYKLSEQKLKQYQEQAPLASIEWDADFNIISWNKAAETMLGYNLGEIQRIDFVDVLIPKAEQPKMQKFCELLISGKGGEHSINDVITKNNKKIKTEWHNKVIFNEFGDIVGFTSIVRDITAETVAYELLKAKESETKEILNTMYDGVFTVNEQGTILSINHAAEKMFGYPHETLIDKNITVLMPPSVVAEHDPYFKSFIKSSKNPISSIGQDVIAMRKNDEEFPMRLSIAELSKDSEGHYRFIGTCQDLTEFKKQQLLMDRFQKMDALGKLTGGIAHDFNNILGVISGYSELLNRKLSQEPSLYKYSEQIFKASARGAELTSKLLSFSSKKSVNTENVNINNLILSIKDMLVKTLTASIVIDFELDEFLWSTQLDVSAFDDCLLNLAINAKYAMLKGGYISIKTSNENLLPYIANKYKLPAGEYICLSFKDNGCGMSASVLQHLFDPFFTTKGDDGTGLGLAQVYGFVQASGGGIDVDSIPDLGTCFKLYFPHSSATDIKNIGFETDTQQNNRYSGSETILLVDDEFLLNEIAKEFLEEQGYKVFTATSAKEALTLLGQKSIDLLISDVIMPKINGYDLAEQIQKILPALPIIFVSGFKGNEDNQDKFLSIPLIKKPYSATILLKNVRNSLDKGVIHQDALSFEEIKLIADLFLNMSKKPFSKHLESNYSDLFEQIKNFNSMNPEQISNIELSTLKKNLVDLLQSHFKREDSLMMKSYYPYAKNHIAVHVLFLKELNRINQNYNKSAMVKWIKDNFLGDYTEHINSMDISFDKFFMENDNVKEK